jgi:hypothetical protein
MQEFDRSREIDTLRRRLLDAPVSEWPALVASIDDLITPVAGPTDVTPEVSPTLGDAGRILHYGGQGDGRMRLGAGDLEIDVRVRMTRVPTGIVHLFERDRHPLVSVTATNHSRDPGADALRVACNCVVEGYSSEARWSDVVKREQSKTPPTIHLLPTFFTERIATLHDVTRATLQVDVQILDNDQYHTRRSHPIWLLPRSSAFWAIEDPSMPGRPIDISRYLCAYVTPNAPLVMQILRRAVEHHRARTFDGYQSSASGVRAQVKAIYNTLRERGMAYISSVTVYGHHLGEIVQRVRLPRESLERRSANCLDGTVLFASLLEAASLKPVVVLLERHALVGWATSPDASAFEYLETTAIADKSFEEAMALGAQQAGSKHARTVSVASARQDGIWPME